MTTYTFVAKGSTQDVDWSDPTVWSGGVVPNAPDADVIFPTVTMVSTGQVYVSFVSIASAESFSVNSVSLTNNVLSIDGDLSVSHDFAIHQGGEINMLGGVLTFGSLENDGTGIFRNGQIDSAGILTNDTLIDGSGLTLTLGGLVNNGELLASSGDLTVNVTSGGFTNLSGTTLTGGTYAAGFQHNSSPNILRLNVGSVVTTDAATIKLDGGGEIDVFDTGSSSFVPIQQTLQTIASSGELSLASQTYNWNPLTIDGTLLLSSSATLNSSQLTVDSGGQIMSIGSSKIVAPIANDGTITAPSPSGTPGGFAATNILDINGAVTGSGMLVIGPGADFGPRHGGLNSAILELGGPVSENVVFSNNVGTLQLDDFRHFTGKIAPAAADDQIVLTGVSFSSLTGFSYSGNSSGGTLTLQTGGPPITLDFLGNFDANSFNFAAGPQQLSSDPPTLLITMVHAAVALSGLTAGNAVEGMAVTATVTDPGAPASGITYTWTVDGNTVLTGTDAAGKTYTPTEADEGKAISVAVSYTDGRGFADNGSASGGTVHESPNENASIALAGLANGHPLEARQLTAAVTESDAPASGITYTWTSNGTVVKTGVDAAGNTYTPAPSDDGHTIAVSASFTDTHGFAESATMIAGMAGGLFVGAGDFDGDSDKNGDLLWQQADGSVVAWDMNGGQIASTNTLGVVPSNWYAAGTADFNGDGNSDVLLQDNAGDVLMWLVSGGNVATQQIVTHLPANWHIAGEVDFNGDGLADILLHSDAGGLIDLQMNGTQVMANQFIAQMPSNWHVAGTADFNGDGKGDILLNSDAGGLIILEMNGAQVLANQFITQVPSNWHVAGTGDFNGDGKSDILLNSDAGGLIILEMNGAQILANTFIGQMPSNWHVAGIADVNGDGKSDILLHSDAGDNLVMEMNGTQTVQQLMLGPNGTPASPPLNAHASAATASVTSSAADASTATAATASQGHAVTGVPEPGGWLSAPDPAAGLSAASHDPHFLV